MEIIRQFIAVEAGGAGRRAGSAITFIHQDQIQVAVVTHLPAAQLAERQQGITARLLFACTFFQVRDTKTLDHCWFLQEGNLHQERLGQVAKGDGGCLDGILAQDVADADAEQLLVLEAVENRIRIRSAAA